MRTWIFRNLVVGFAFFCTFLLISCSVLYEYQGAIKSRSYSYSFGRYYRDSLPRYDVTVSIQGSSQKFKKDELNCGKGDNAVEFHFSSDQKVLLLWWALTDGSPGYPCYVAFEERPTGLLRIDSSGELSLLNRVTTALQIALHQGQPMDNSKHLIQDYAIKHKLIDTGKTVGYLEIK